MALARKVMVATVSLWGETVGAIAWDKDKGIGAFEYAQDFIRRGLEISPLTMPIEAGRIYSFPELNRKTFYGLPGLVADSLPDQYGNKLIEVWLARQKRNISDFTPVERLCYMGSRGTGALEFKPATGPRSRTAAPLEVSELAQLAAEILNTRTTILVNMKNQAKALDTIVRVGTSAAGARAKAVIAWNPKTGDVRSGQVPAPAGFEPWILKFDSDEKNAPGDPKGFGRIEYAYHKMAAAAGMEMTNCRLLEEGGRAHFMTRRFDRDAHGEKVHMQSLCAMAHYDYNAHGEYSYEQAFTVIRKLNLGHPTIKEMFRRMIFNVLARNQDDHTRNTAFLMDKNGNWNLSPAFDVIWCHNPQGQWANRHQMTINGKQDGFRMQDIMDVAGKNSIGDARDIFGQVHEAVSQWEKYAKEAGVDREMSKHIAKTHRRLL